MSDARVCVTHLRIFLGAAFSCDGLNGSEASCSPLQLTRTLRLWALPTAPRYEEE